MRKSLAYIVIAVTAVTGCMSFKVKQALGPTAWILVHAQPALQQESDYELARSAVPGALKTVEGFWIVDPDTASDLLPVLTEGYCQYGTAFVEDDWEVAKFAKKLDEVEANNQRASNAFTRCLNYALKQLGPRWQKDLFGAPEAVAALAKDTGENQRDAMMWATLALGSLINHNLTRVEMLSYLPTVKVLLTRLIELDTKYPPANKVYAALPHIAMGMIMSAASAQFGGDAAKATAEFQAALAITGDKMLLARALWGYRIGVMTNDRKLFHEQLVKVLETPGSVWPEQRLANEVAHRRARRYLSHEKELFQ